MTQNTNLENTVLFKVEKEDDLQAKEILLTVYESLLEKGYNPINQLVGYLLSGDPAYITSHNNARNLIRRLDRDEVVEELLLNFLDKK